MLELCRRMSIITLLFNSLENHSSRIDKECFIERTKVEYPDVEDDLTYCFEILSGMHKIGFTLSINDCGAKVDNLQISLREFCDALFHMDDHSDVSIWNICQKYKGYGWFLNPLFNREWKLGIGPSQLEKQDISPMLAKKFDPDKIPDDPEGLYYLTEKIDGNRCESKFNYETNKWEFYSRSGKRLKVDFDLADLPKDKKWDGEVVSESQYFNPSQSNFNATSGIINSKYGSKSGLIYLIFDFISKIPYKERRQFIGGILSQKSGNYISNNVRILPVLEVCKKSNLVERVNYWLNKITSIGGEGVMINLGSAVYQNKRTDKLLKVKNVYTMDMKVIDIIPGTSKNEGLVGSLECFAKDESTGDTYTCQVGSGLSDYQREHWMFNQDEIIGKIVEVAYFSLSQSASARGSKVYSLRFPRLKGVRKDKADTSID